MQQMSKYLNLITTHLKWALSFLSQHHVFQGSQLHMPESDIDEKLSTYQYRATDESEATECAICLTMIEEGEEIREWRCNHIFHRVCSDRWVIGYGHTSCPLCRDPLVPRTIITELGRQVLVFKFCSFRSSDNGRDTWWLR